jgi:Uma2 family endonuclease
MAATAILPPPSADNITRKRFTRDEVERMLDAGLFDGQRYELIGGDLIDKMGQKPPHAFSISILLAWLSEVFGSGCVRAQLPIEAGTKDRKWNLPEPDLAVLAQTTNADYRGRHPRGDELQLAIEVADTTLRHDLTTKRSLYARAGVPEYWVLDIQGRRLLIHRQPRRGDYGKTDVWTETRFAAPESRPENRIRVAKLLP